VSVSLTVRKRKRKKAAGRRAGCSRLEARTAETSALVLAAEALAALVCVVLSAAVVAWAQRRSMSASGRGSEGEREGERERVRDAREEREDSFEGDADAQEAFARELARSGFFGGEDELFFEEDDRDYGDHEEGGAARDPGTSLTARAADSPRASTAVEAANPSERRAGSARRRFGNSRGGGGPNFSARPNAMRMLEALEALSQEAESLERSGAGGGLGIPQSLRGLLEQLNDAGAGGETAVRQLLLGYMPVVVVGLIRMLSGWIFCRCWTDCSRSRRCCTAEGEALDSTAFWSNWEQIARLMCKWFVDAIFHSLSFSYCWN
jgi:hypothetical protein